MEVPLSAAATLSTVCLSLHLSFCGKMDQRTRISKHSLPVDSQLLKNLFRGRKTDILFPNYYANANSRTRTTRMMNTLNFLWIPWNLDRKFSSQILTKLWEVGKLWTFEHFNLVKTTLLSWSNEWMAINWMNEMKTNTVVRSSFGSCAERSFSLEASPCSSSLLQNMVSSTNECGGITQAEF